MPRYSDELIEEVRSRNDIVDVISQYVRLSKKGSTYFGLCPFHNEKTGSFSVSPNKQMYYCFGCHAGGNVFTFLMQYENYTFGEAMEALAERAASTSRSRNIRRRSGRRRTGGHVFWRSTRRRQSIFLCCFAGNAGNVRLIILKRGRCPMRRSTSSGWDIRISTAMICTGICGRRAMTTRF